MRQTGRRRRRQRQQTAPVLTGYLSMGFITSPLDFAMWPYFVVITWGSGFMMKASLSLVGQEAPIKERGSVVAMSGMFGAIGILIFTKWGGIAFDAWAPSAPFVMAGIYQAVLLILAIIVRIVAPGRPAPNPFFRSRATAGETVAVPANARLDT